MAETGHSLARLLDELLQVMFGKQRNITGPFTQGWLCQRDDVDAVVKVLTKLPFANRLFQIEVRGENHADIDFLRLRRADRFEFTVLKNSKKLDLQAGRSGSDFVEENRSPIGLQKFPHLVVIGSGESSCDMTEKLTFQQRIRQCTASNFNERFVPAVTHLMDGAGGHRFAGTGFTKDQNRGPHVRHAFNYVEHFLHAIVVPDDISHTEPLIKSLLQLTAFVDNLFLTECPVDRESQFIVNNRFGEVIKGSQTNCVHGAFDRAKSGEQNDLCFRSRLRRPFEQSESILIGQVHVTDDGVEGTFFDPLNRIQAILRGFSPVTKAAKEVGHRFQHQRIIINKQKGTMIHHLNAFQKEVFEPLVNKTNVSSAMKVRTLCHSIGAFGDAVLSSCRRALADRRR